MVTVVLVLDPLAPNGPQKMPRYGRGQQRGIFGSFSRSERIRVTRREGYEDCYSTAGQRLAAASRDETHEAVPFRGRVQRCRSLAIVSARLTDAKWRGEPGRGHPSVVGGELDGVRQ